MADFNPQDIVNLQTPKIEMPSVTKPMQDVYKSILNKTEQGFDLSAPSKFGQKQSGFLIGETSKRSLESRNYNIDDAYGQLSDGTYVAKFDTYKDGIDNNEYFAQNQSTGEKWANGGIKFLDKTFNAVLGGTAGVVYGLGAALANKSMDSIYDNDFSNYLDDMDTKMNYQFANYYKKQDENAGVFGQMTQANFWADKFLGGLAFTAGAIVSEGLWDVATGGMAMGTGLARATTKFASTASKVAQAERWGLKAVGETALIDGLSAYKKLTIPTLGSVYKTGVQGKQLAIIAGKTGELLSIAGRTIRSAGYEASVEALQYKKEAEGNFYRNFSQEYGREPDAKEIKEFEESNNSASNAVFGVNTGIVGISNVVGLGHVLNIKNPINLGVSEFINKKAFGYGLDKTTNAVIKSTTLQNVSRNLFDYIAKPGFTEGLFEEGLQGVTNKTANKWIENSYSPNQTNKSLDLIDDFYDSMQEQYGTEKGWKDNILGIITGIAGGAKGVRGEQNEKTKELDYQSKVAITFNNETLQRLILPSKLQSVNRSQAFTEQSKIEEDKGNLTKAQINKESAILDYVNSGLVLGKSIKEMTSSMKESIDSITNKQWSDVGVDNEQIEQEKTDRINSFTELANQWKTNKTYWKYMIGSKIAGEQGLDETALEEGLGSSFSKNSQIIEALAYNSTIGERSSGIMNDIRNKIGEELGEENKNIFESIGEIKKSNLEVKKKVKTLQVEAVTIETRRNLLLKQIERLDATPKLEGSQDQKIKRLNLSSQLIEAEEKLSKVKQEAEEIAKTFSSAKKYQQNLSDINLSGNLESRKITGDDLLNLDNNINKFKSALDYQKTTNPQLSSYLEGLLSEYSQAESMFMQSQATQNAVLSKDFKMKNIEGYLKGKFNKNTEMNEDTKEWLQSALETYSKNKTRIINENLEKKEELVVNEEIVSEEKILVDNTTTQAKSEQQANQEKTEELEIERAEALSKVESTIVIESIEPIEQVAEIKLVEEDTYQKEIDKINKDFDKKINDLKPQGESNTVEEYKKRVENLLKTLYTDIQNIPKNSDDISQEKPTKEEIEKYRELRKNNKQNTKEGVDLRKKLQNWKVLATSVDYDYTSIAEMLDLIEQLQEEKQEVQTKDSITDKDVNDVMFSEIRGSGSDNAKNQLINPNANATVKYNEQGKVELTHIKAQYIVNQIGKPYSVTRKGKLVNTSLNNLEVGDIIEIDGIPIEFDYGARLKMDIDDFQKRQQVLNLYVRDTRSTSWNFIDMYSVIGQQEVKTPSQFRDELVQDLEALNSQKEDRLTLNVDNTDGWNSTEKGNNEDNFKIYLKDKSGVIVQTLKAGYSKTGSSVDPVFLNLRKQAFEKWSKAGKPDKMDLNISVEIDNVFLGSTEMLFENKIMVEGNISQEATDRIIIGKGYILNGEFTLDNEIKDVNKTYVGALSKKNENKKIPVIIFKKGVHNIAYPITMVKSSEPINFESLLTGTPQEIVLKVNQAIIENKINAQKIGFEDVVVDSYSGDILLSDKAKQTKIDFESNQKFITADIIAKKSYKKENLINDATIRIDLDNLDQVMSSAKIRIKLDETIKGLNNEVDNQIEKFGINNEQLFTEIEEVKEGDKNICN